MTQKTDQQVRTEAARELLSTREEAAVPAIYEHLADEIEEQPRTISLLAARDVEAAQKAARALQQASIQLTYPSDWVVFEAKDRARLAYLQDAGCQRVRSLWGIDFSKFDPRNDLESSDTLDGHYAVEAYVEGHCRITGEVLQEIGWRSSAGLFEKAWGEARKDEQHVIIAKLKSDVKKSAIANGQGRIVRRATGLSQVPEEVVCRLLSVKLGALRGFTFREGSQGGGASSTSDASEAQINLVVNEAVRGKKVAGAASLEVIRGFVVEAKLTKQSASDLIKKLKDAAPGAVSSDQFLALLGIGVGAKQREPGEDG